MRTNMSLTGVVLPGLVAGVMFVVISLATGTSAATSLSIGILIAIVAILIGVVVRAFFVRRVASGRS
jgi:uncharacterized membrane protein